MAQMLQPEKLLTAGVSRPVESPVFCHFHDYMNLTVDYFWCLRSDAMFVCQMQKRESENLSICSNFKSSCKAVGIFAVANLAWFLTGYKNNLYFNKHDD